MASHATARILLVTSVLGLAYSSVVSCSGSDTSKHAMDENGGEGGDQAHAGTPSTGGSKAGSAAGGVPGAGTAGTSLGGEPGSSGGGEGGAPSSAGSAATGGAGADAGGVGSDAGGVGGDATAAGGAGGASDACQASTVGSRISIAFDAKNAEWVKSLTWRDSTDTLTPNVVANDGVQACNTVAEFFGQAYGAPEGTLPLVVVGPSRGSATDCGADHVITSGASECTFTQVPTTTEYHFYGGAKASQMRVTRTIGFDATTPKYNGTVGLRVWQPRVVLATFGNTIYPNTAETGVTTKPLNTCPGDCLIGTSANWSGRWFADIATNGLAIIVLRDPAMTAPVDLTINYDSNSSSNLSSFVNLQPQDGWKAPVTEVQYLCFADLASWPQTDRDAAKLPAWCGP